ncbi:lauroyl acyltransferase [Terasakiella sp. A23]|uniref:lysophospholipid acyltransferase family protein n=1 Tax=Terasakiella sp. FCG-A23 TaxID=3080561 RepID=UPI002954C186|nr:lauroyl acyltransferase [Terasakiella sp. A23]MDV7338027.1 lauroyl acyltransferase [Terasakiella sp. A23]
MIFLKTANSVMRAFIQKYISHPLQGMTVHTIFFLMGLIPIDTASAIGGKIGRLIGPRLKVHKLGLENLKKAFPDKSAAEIETIMAGVWDNLGRTSFELAHIPKLNLYDHPERFEIVGGEYIDLVRDDDQCGIIFSGHMANWEFSARTMAQRTPPLPLGLIFREPDNPWVNGIFDKRKPVGCELIPKGAKGARRALEILKSGGHLALLVDQKMNDGIPVPFFGHDAMTAPAMAQFALKFNCPLVPMRIERKEGAYFRMTYYPPIDVPLTGNRKEDILAIMTTVNQILEDWITERPEQWLWLHRRWPKD